MKVSFFRNSQQFINYGVLDHMEICLFISFCSYLIETADVIAIHVTRQKLGYFPCILSPAETGLLETRCELCKTWKHFHFSWLMSRINFHECLSWRPSFKQQERFPDIKCTKLHRLHFHSYSLDLCCMSEVAQLFELTLLAAEFVCVWLREFLVLDLSYIILRKQCIQRVKPKGYGKYRIRITF